MFTGGVNNIAASDTNNITTGTTQSTNFTNTAESTTVSKVETINDNYFSGVRTRSVIEPEFRYNKFPKVENVPRVLEMDYSRILHKPYFVPPISWSTVQTGVIQRYAIPDDILVNPLAQIPFTASVFYRAKISAIVQVAGTPMHQGCVVVSAVPIRSTSLSGTPWAVNTRMSAPHVFLNANEATSARLEIPFYVNGKLQPVDLTGTTIVPSTYTDNYADVEFYVLNPLVAPTSGSTSVSISVHFVFTELEFYVPHVDVTWVPFVGEGASDMISSSISKFFDGIFSMGKRFTTDLLDAGRVGLREYTGLHNPEYPLLCARNAVQFRQNLNVVDGHSFVEKLDPYSDFSHITNDYTFDTDIDEMHLKEILTKPQYIGHFQVDTTDVSGRLLWTRPITPIQEVNPGAYVDANGVTQYTNFSSNLLQTFAMMSRYWRGGLKVHIQAVMSNFHYCKLTVARDYSTDTNMLNSVPSFDSVANLMMETVEFSAGGQIQTIKMPFCSSLNQLPTTTDFVMNALSHGMYYIYLHQPLVTNGTVSNSVQFNVYVSADDDFDFFGYAVNPLLFNTEFAGTPSFVGESSAAPLQVSEQESLDLKRHSSDTTSPIYDLRPIKSVRDYSRRFYKVYSARVTQLDVGTFLDDFVIPIGLLFGNSPNISALPIVSNSISTIALINKMFVGYSGGLKFKVVINGSSIGEAWYVPPSYSIDPVVGEWVGTAVFPQGAGSPGSNLQEPLREMFRFPERFPPVATYDPAYAVQTVSVERPNYLHSQPGYIMSDADPTTNINRIAMSCMEFEFEVPHMSPFRFVGSGLKSKNVSSNEFQYNSSSEMGNIVIKFANPINYAPGVATQPQAVGIEIFLATTDEGRFGYQVMAPPVGIPALGVGTAPLQSFYQLAPNTTNISGAPVTPYSTVVSNPSSPGLYSIASCYYAKIT